MGAPHLGCTSAKPVACSPRKERKSNRRVIAYACIATLVLVLGVTVVLAGYYGIRYHNLLASIECDNTHIHFHVTTAQSDISTSIMSTEDGTTPTTDATTTSIVSETTTMPQFKHKGEVMYTWKLRIIRRQEWSGNHAYQPDPLKIPVEYVIVVPTETEACLTETDCTYIVRHIHTKHKGFGLYCIGFNFLIGGDGNVYEGRGWYRRGVYTAGYTTKAISIGFIGNFQEDEPEPSQIETAQQLIANGVKFGTISPEYKLVSSQQETALQRVINTWPHWSDEIIQ